MQSNTLLKVCSILMIIGAALSIILTIVALAGVGILIAAGVRIGLMIFSAILMILACVIQMIAGIKGLQGAKDPVLGSKCTIWGILIIAISVVSIILNLAAGNGFSFISFLLNMILPVLYIIGTLNSKKMLAQ